MIPGEILPAAGEIEINAGRPTLKLGVANTGDRPIQVGSHYHFAETNAALAFDRAAARGYRHWQGERDSQRRGRCRIRNTRGATIGTVCIVCVHP